MDTWIIFGSGAGAEHVPLDRDDSVVIGQNNLYTVLERRPRHLLWFEMHRREDWWLPPNGPYNPLAVPAGKYARRADHADQLRALECPIYMQDVDAEFPTSVMYPLDDAIAVNGHRPYFADTMAMIVALAMVKQISRLEFYGVSMLHDRFTERRECLSWLLGLFIGRGGRLAIEQPSALLQAKRLYAYDAPPAGSIEDLTARLLDANEQRERILKRWTTSWGYRSRKERQLVAELDRVMQQTHDEIFSLKAQQLGVIV